MASVSRIVELASAIKDHTTKVDNYLSSKGLPSPSFETSTPPQLDLPDEIVSSKNGILEAIDELHTLILGPMPFLFHQVIQKHNNLISLQSIYRFNIATSFGVDEKASYSEIAKTCKMDESDLTRVLRHAFTMHIFKEPEEGFVAHTAASKTLAEIPLLRQWLGHCMDEMWPAAARTVDAMATWPGSEELNQTGFNLATNTSEPYFVDISKSPSRIKRFADAMSFFHAGPGLETSLIMTDYDWAALGKGTVVDVGGSNGPVAIELARTFPFLRCICQDLPDVVATCVAPEDLADRLSFQAHDFFTEQPVKDADVYFFRMIFHNWPDKYSIQILRNLIPALKPGAKIVISDFCVPDTGILPPYQDRDVRCFDLAMKAVFNAKERNLDDWAKLFRNADPGFELLGAKKSPKSQLSIIEARWKEQLDS